MDTLVFRADRPTQVVRRVYSKGGSLTQPIEDDVRLEYVTMLPLEDNWVVDSFSIKSIYSDSTMVDFREFLGAKVSVFKSQWDLTRKEFYKVEYQGKLHEVDETRLVFDLGDKLQVIPRNDIESIVVPKSSKSDVASFLYATIKKHTSSRYSDQDTSDEEYSPYSEDEDVMAPVIAKETRYDLTYETNKLMANVAYNFNILERRTKMQIEMRIHVANQGKVEYKRPRISLFVEVLPHGWPGGVGRAPEYMQVMDETDDEYTQSYRIKRASTKRMLMPAITESALAPGSGEYNTSPGDAPKASNSESVVRVSPSINIEPNSRVSLLGFSKIVKCAMREIFDPEKDSTNFNTEIVWENDGVLPGGPVTIFERDVYGEIILELGKVTLLSTSEKKITILISKAVGITANLQRISEETIKNSNNRKYSYLLTIYSSQLASRRVLTIRNRFPGDNWEMATKTQPLKFSREEFPEDEQYKTSSSIGVATLEIDGLLPKYQYEFSVIVRG